MKVMLTGASGYLGRMIYELGKGDYEWVLFDAAPAEQEGNWIQGDVRDRQALARAAEGCGAMIHTAALHTIRWDALGDDESFLINTMGTKNVLQAAVDSGVPRVVYTSSIRAAGHERPESLPTTEEAVARPNELYGLSKAVSEQLCRYYADNHGLQTICLRPAAIRTAREGVVSFHFLFEWVDVRDVARAHLRALETAFANTFEVMLIASDTPMADVPAEVFRADPVGCMRDMAVRHGVAPEAVERCEGFSVYAGKDPGKIEWFSVEKARRLMGYNPEYGFARWPGRG